MISTTRAAFLAAFIVLMVSMVSGQYYYEDSYSITQQSSMSLPQFDSQQEILTELVAPFIFMSILLQFFLQKALHFTLRDGDDYPAGIRFTDSKPDVRREATLMAVTITGILVPTPFWNYIRLAIASIGIVAVTMFVGVLFFLVYLFWKGG